MTTKFSNNHQQQPEKVQGKIVLFLQGECVDFSCSDTILPSIMFLLSLALFSAKNRRR